MSKIEWTQKTWNPTIGCREVSPGCTNCYAARMAHRLAHIPATAETYAGLTKKVNDKIVWTGLVKSLPERLKEPLLVKKPTVWFVDSMSDLFHADVDFEFIDKVFAVMALTPQHTYQVLTKRADRLVEWSQRQRARICTELDLMGENFEEAGNNEMVERCIDASVQIISGSWPLPNIWLGVSVENQKAADERIPKLLQVPAAVRFLSCEPLLGAVDLSNFQYEVIGPEGKVHYRRPITDGALRSEALSTKHYSVKGIDWVICGGESGPGARPMHPDWARSLRDQCAAAGMPFFFKQWGDYLPDCQIESAMPGIITKNAAFQFPSPHNKDKMNTYHKLGKKISGRLLDGKEHNEYPKQ